MDSPQTWLECVRLLMSDEPTFRRRAPIRSLSGVRIVATGGFVPEGVVRNEDLAALGCDPEWIIQRTGIRERRHAAADVATSDLAVKAAEQCIDRAGIDRAEIDLLVLGTYTPDMPIPGTAGAVQDHLGLCCGAMDVQAACAGFVYSLITAAQYVATGGSKWALVIGADCNSRIINPDDKKTYPLFGDGAGAVLLTAGSDEQGPVSYSLGADGSGAELLCRPMGGARTPPTPELIDAKQHFVQMDGRPVFKWAVRLLDDSIRSVLDHAGKKLEDVDLLVLHQANQRIIDAVADNLGIDGDKVLANVDRYGYTSAASIPLVLDEAASAGRIEPGANVLMSGFGAGLSWGTTLWRW